MKLIIYTLFLFSIVGCASTADLASFPKVGSAVNFDEVSKRNMHPDGSGWTFKGRSEYMIFVNTDDEKTLFDALVKAAEKQGFLMKYSDMQSKAIIGERGLRMNEWNSIAGIYYRKYEAGYQVYIRVDITQDITGGWKENRAKKIADEICRLLTDCR